MPDRHTPSKYLKKTAHTYRNEGVKVLIIKAIRKTANVMHRTADTMAKNNNRMKRHKFMSLVDLRDVMGADLDNKPKIPPKPKKKLKVVNWIMSPPRSGGGHQNMFRFIEYLDGLGYVNNIYLYSTEDFMTVDEAKKNVSKYASLERANFYRHKHGQEMVAADVIFATGWETAYPLLNQTTFAKKMYFVQDFEPLFYPVGTDYILAENTYKFGFKGITAGRWLSHKLSSEYGMSCESYDFGADADLYSLQNVAKRREVFFYARPVTERRAFDLGIMVLEEFHKMHPDYVINLAGWDVSDYSVPFPYVNHKTLHLEELPALYNRCAVGLVLSLTNMSLLPLELLACGVIPVVNDGENNTMVSDNKYIAYAPPLPRDLAKRMSDVVSASDWQERAKQASESVRHTGWDAAKKKFTKIIEEEIDNG